MRRSCASCACGISTSLCITPMKTKAFALFAFICVHLRTSAFDQVVAGMTRSYGFKQAPWL
jgi:hypothetical protein